MQLGVIDKGRPGAEALLSFAGTRRGFIGVPDPWAHGDWLYDERASRGLDV